MSTLAKVLSCIEHRWHGTRILVIGDVMLDQYVWGTVERISPEAPVPVVRAERRTEQPGGAANVAMNLAGLGAAVTLVGFAGQDELSHTLENALVENGVEPELVTLEDTPTTSKLRVISGHHQMIRIDTEAAAIHADPAHAELLGKAFALLPTSQVVVLSDYAKGVLTATTTRAIISEAQRHGVPVLVDPKSRNFARYRGATTICPNLKELALATGETVGDLDLLFAAGQRLLWSLDMDYMAVTLSEKGIAILRADTVQLFPADVRQVCDVSGAGDTVIAVLGMAIASGIPIDTAAQLANIAAGLVVSKVGTVPVLLTELMEAVSGKAARGAEEKMLPLNEMLNHIALWRATGQQIVFTNGCFDLLHAGHVALLQQAKSKGDRLIVGLNSDDSVSRLKGPDRPIIAARDRARILAALSAVDAIVCFEEDTPLSLIMAIRPDVLVKGGDYCDQEVVGAREVQSWGGSVELIPLVDGHSTTALLQRAMECAAAD